MAEQFRFSVGDTVKLKGDDTVLVVEARINTGVRGVSMLYSSPTPSYMCIWLNAARDLRREEIGEALLVPHG